MVGIEAYFSIRKHVSDTGFAAFENIEDKEGALNEKVCFFPFVLCLSRHIYRFDKYAKIEGRLRNVY